MKVKKLKNYLIFTYIALLIGGYFYVSNILNHTEVIEVDKDEEKVEEVKPLVVYLNVEGDKTYRSRLSTEDTVNDLFEALRDNKELFFEKTRYTYGNELDEVGHTKTPDEYKWKVFLNDEDITYQMDKLRLKDETTYTLRLVKQ